MMNEIIGSLTIKNRDLLMALMNLIKAGELTQTYIQNEKYQPELHDDDGWKLHERVDDSLSQALVEAKKVIEAKKNAD